MESLLVSFIILGLLSMASAGNLYQDLSLTWGGDRGKILNNGQAMSLSLDQSSGSGFQSKNKYMYGRFDMQIKLVPGNSAGTVTTFYLSSTGMGSSHDEIDMEFLGNVSGQPYILHTNVYIQGKGNREQQFYLWFDPTKNFHTYSILWNPQTIIFSVDGIPIRQYKNLRSRGIPYPKSNPMWLFGSLWDAENWATRGGLVKTDWTQAPFTTFYRNFNSQACAWPSSRTCSSASPGSWINQELDNSGANLIKWARKNYMIYNYCDDTRRFPQGLPPECSFN